MATRNKVRLNVVELLYSFDMGNVIEPIEIDTILEDKKIKHQKKEFAIELLFGTLDNLEETDDEITENLNNWELNRLGYVQRACIRLGVFEILHYETQGVIAINEIIIIAKIFCDKKSVDFINAILDNIYKTNKKQG